MNLISDILDRYTHHDDEKKLALSIALVSFFIFITILLLIISTSYVYQRNDAYRSFLNENKFIENREEIPEFIRIIPPNIAGIQNSEKRHGPRDVIIFDKEKKIIRNDFLDLTRSDIDFLFSLGEITDTSIEFTGHTYFIARNDQDAYTTFLFHDLTPLRGFHLTLLIVALLGSLIWLIVIYTLARYLARITIEPIREQARELEAYSHNVAHELRTPLSIMRSNLELLRLRPEARFIDSTDEEVTSMERIIESLLFLAKPDGSDLRRELDITAKTIEIIEKYIPENPIKFTSKKTHIHTKCSGELYSRILCNLIENAIKYKSEWYIIISLSKSGINISNQITNNMSSEELSNITKVFYQWDESRNSTGYGLGLALVAKIVEISGWTMSISAHNKRFTVEIIF